LYIQPLIVQFNHVTTTVILLPEFCSKKATCLFIYMKVIDVKSKPCTAVD